MSKYWTRAASLQNAVRQREAEQREMHLVYDKEEVDQAIVHTRQDVILLSSLVNSLCKQIRFQNFFLVIIALISLGIALQI